MDDPESRKATRPARELLGILRPHTRPYRGYVAVILLCLMLGLPLAWATPWLVQQVFDVAVPSRDGKALLRFGLLIALVTFLAAVLALIRGICTTLYHNKALHRLRLRLFHTFQSLSLGWIQNRETGELMSRLSDEVVNLGGVMADSFAAAISAGIQFMVVAAILFTRDWRLASAAVIGAAFLLGIHFVFNKPLRNRSLRLRERSADLTAGMHQAITGHLLIRATASEPFESRRFSRLLAATVRAAIGRDLFGLWSGHPTVVFGGIFPLSLLLLAAYFVAEGNITQGELFAFFILLGQLFDAAMTLGRLNPSFQSSLASLDRIADVLDAGAQHRQPTGPRTIESIRGDVTFENVSFRYQPAPDGDLVLKGISFSVPAGSTVAVVGRSGAGKTTLLSLIPKFFEPTEGRILIDEVPLSELDTSSLRRQIGVVPQDVFLFDRSVEENIAYGLPGAGSDAIRAAAVAARCTAFVEALPNGFKTRIGERGVKLSGGQRQRLAIARELLRNPRIIILDEATSSLDSETEREIQAAFSHLLEGRTSFVIAHRLATVMHADVTLVLDEGRLVAQGRHDDLLVSCAQYRRLALLQELAEPKEPSTPWIQAS